MAAGTGSVTPGLPTGWAVNDHLILACETDSGEAVSTPSGWTALYSGIDTTGGTNTTRLSTFWKKAVSGESAPTISDPGNHCVAVIAAFYDTNITASTPFDTIAVSSSSSDGATVTFPAITTTLDNCLVVNIVADGLDSASSTRYSSLSNSNLSSLTERFDGGSTQGSGGGIGIFTGIKSTAGSTGSTTVNLLGFAGQARITFALKPNITPNAFTFADVVNATRTTVYTSNLITISGADGSEAISISGGGGTYSINGGSYTSSSGTITNGDVVRVTVTSSSSYDTAVSTTLTVGGVSDTFTVTTNTDSTPGAFTFTDVTGATPSTVYESNAITVSAINTGSAISISGGSGSYSINGGAYTTATGTVYVGNTVKVRVTSSSSYSTAVSTTLTIGGVSDTYSVTTISSGDTTPTAFTFTDVTGATISTTYTSNTITVAGIDTASPISVTGGTYSKNGGAFTTVAGTVVSGDTVSVRAVSSSAYSTAVSVVLTIGGVSDTYTVTTAAGTSGVPRIAIGKRGSTSDFGLFVSKPGVNVLTASTPESFLFSSAWTAAGLVHASGTITANSTVTFTPLPFVPVVFCWVVYSDGTQGIKAMSRTGSGNYHTYWDPGLSEYQYDYEYDYEGYQEPLLKVSNSSIYMEKASTWLGGSDTGNSARYVVLNMKGGV